MEREWPPSAPPVRGAADFTEPCSHERSYVRSATHLKYFRCNVPLMVEIVLVVTPRVLVAPPSWAMKL